MDFKLEDEITLMEFNNKDKNNINVQGQLILYKDDAILGIVNKNGFEIFVCGKKVEDKILIRNVIDDSYIYDLSNNKVFYKKEDKLYDDGIINFDLKTVDFDIKKVDRLNRKILDHNSNKDGMKNTTNRVLVLKDICTNI